MPVEEVLIERFDLQKLVIQDYAHGVFRRYKEKVTNLRNKKGHALPYDGGKKVGWCGE